MAIDATSESSHDVATVARGSVLNLVGSRGLGARGAGLFLEAVALFTILSNAGELGADTGVVRMIPRLRALGRGQDVRRTLVVALVPVGVLGIAFAAAVYMLAPELARVFFHGVHR